MVLRKRIEIKIPVLVRIKPCSPLTLKDKRKKFNPFELKADFMDCNVQDLPLTGIVSIIQGGSSDAANQGRNF